MHAENHWNGAPFPPAFVNFLENFFGEQDWEKINKNVNDMRDEFAGWGKEFGKSMQGKAPFVNSIETPTHYRVEVAAPGLSKEDFKITVEKQFLTIAVEKERILQEGEHFRRQEFSFHNFKRTFRLSKGADTEQVSAKYENGLLLISIAKQVAHQDSSKRDIEVS